MKSFRAEPEDFSRAAAAPARGKLFWRGFAVSMTNPKTMLFYAAFFPQFIENSAPVVPQLVIMSGSFLLLAILLNGSYGLLAGRMRQVFRSHRFQSWRPRIVGVFLLGAAIGLGLARRPV